MPLRSPSQVCRHAPEADSGPPFATDEAGSLKGADMRRLLLCAALAMPVAGVAVLGGCDREISSETKTDVKDDGTVVKEETKVTENAEGGVTKEETKSVDKPETVKKEETTVKNADGTVKKEETKTVD